MQGSRAPSFATALAAGVAVIAALFGGGTTTASAAPSAAQIEVALVVEMNRVRDVRNRPPLRSISSLRLPARAQSQYLAPLGFLDHAGPDGSEFWTRLVAAGFPRNRYMAENLALLNGCEIDIARRTVRMWMNSPGHRANLLSPKFRWVGAGIASTADCSATVATADYGS